MRRLREIADSMPEYVQRQAAQVAEAEMSAWGNISGGMSMLRTIYQMANRPDMLESLDVVFVALVEARRVRDEMMDSLARAALDGRMPEVGG